MLHVALARRTILWLTLIAGETLQGLEGFVERDPPPVATLNICLAAFCAAAVHASRFASTGFSIQVKSRLCSPSPLIVGCSPRNICVVNFASTPE
jgi:hypothetical protein